MFFISINTSAQTEQVGELRPMTPNIAALFKLTERPGGSFTGTVPVSFPLMTVSSGPLSVNFSLDYSTSGIKVEEVASSIGLGFSFNDGGGRIVQIVNGLPDDQPNGLLDPSQPVKPSNFDCSNSSHLFKAYSGLELEPDVYMYSFAGKSGRFNFREDGAIINTNENGLKIERYSDGFKIIDGEGIQYYFTTISQNSYGYGGGTIYSPSPIKSSNWYLTEIRDINNENQIKFTYVSSSGSFHRFSSGYLVLGGTLPCNGIIPGLDQKYVRTTSTEMVLARVEGRSGYILCNSSDDRMDMVSAKKINSLEAYDAAGTLKKKYKFNYTYRGYSPNARLMLENFSEFGTGTVDSLVYKFEYNSDLPAYNSKAVDFWGYYNGKINNSSYFSDLVYRSGNTILREMRNEVDRTPNPDYAKRLSLSKVTYPSGGSRQFIYEGNTISQYVNFNEFVPDPDVANAQTFSITNFSGGGSSGTYAQKFFTVNSTYGGAYFKVGVSGSSTANVIQIYRAGAGTTTGGTLMVGENGQSGVYKWDLPNGNYRLDVKSLTVSNLNASWSECTVAEGTFYNKEAGGIRIKEIRDYDPVTNNTNTTKYLYKRYSKDSTMSSGQAIVALELTENEYARPSCMYKRLNANGNYPLTTDGGSYVVYTEVRTIEEGNGWYDRVYRYIGDFIIWGNPKLPLPNNSNSRGQLESEKIYDQSGFLLKRSMYGYKMFSSGLMQSGIRFRAIFGLDKPMQNLYSTFTPQQGYLSPTSGWCSNWTIGSSKLAMSYAIDSVFSSTGVNVTRTDYTYEEIDKSFLTKQVKTTINNGATKEVNYRYASTPNAEFIFTLSDSEQGMKTALFNKNYLQPLEVTNTITAPGNIPTLLGGKKMTFNTFNGSMLHLSSVKDYSSPSDFRETFLSSYDDKGNLRVKYIDPSLKEIYLWGYNGVYPVAKVIGSDENIVYSGIDLSILNNPTNDKTLRTHLDAIRNHLIVNLAQVETYTYNPNIGMTSSTDAKGMVTYYEYDNFGRLKLIKDQNGNIVKAYNYHYKQ